MGRSFLEREVEVLGVDPQGAGSTWREQIGVMLQSSSLYPNLTAIESLRVFAGYYAAPRDPNEVIEIVGLDEKRDARVRTERQRMRRWLESRQVRVLTAPLRGRSREIGRADLVVWRASNGTWYWLTSSSGYALAGALSYVDLSFFQIVAGLEYAFPREMARRRASIPLLRALCDRVMALPRIAAYLSSPRRIPFNTQGIFRHYPELDA